MCMSTNLHKSDFFVLTPSILNFRLPITKELALNFKRASNQSDEDPRSKVYKFQEAPVRW